MSRIDGVPAGLRDGGRVRVVNASRGLVLAERAAVAASPWSRLRGLLGRPPLAAGQALLIVPCQSVHTVGMGYPLDVVHLDRHGVVLRVVRELKPWRFGPLIWRSRMVLELPAGAAAGTAEGDRLTLEPVDPDTTS